MSASEVASNPFWYVNSTAALSSRDRLSIFVLAMCISPSTNLDMMGTGKPVKSAAFFWPATIRDPDVPDRAFECGHVARSSIGTQFDPRDEAGVVRAQKERGLGDLFGLRHAAHWDGRHDAPEGLSRHGRLQRRRKDRSRAKNVRADAPVLQFHGPGSRE